MLDQPTINQEIGQLFPKIPKQFNKKNISIFWSIFFAILILIWIMYFSMPVWNFQFASLYFALGFIFVPLLTIKWLRRILKYAYLILGLVLIFMIFSTLPLFRAQSYRNVLGEVKMTKFTDLISPVNLEQIPVVDPSLALMLGEKKLGDDFALGSRVTLGHPTRQMVNGKLIFAIPLLHSGFFKWLTNLDGTPAYIVVSATNPQEVRLVREINGKPIRIKYQQAAYFQQNLYRKIYQHGLINVGITDFTFELDDAGIPYWTATIYKRKVGFSGDDAIGVALVRCDTGEVSYCTLDKIPQWVDRAQPTKFIITQLDWWGAYVHGFWNSVLGKRDMLKNTKGYNIIYSDDGKCYLYTGMSSVGSDEGAVGFVLVDTRSKKTHFYKLSGATEVAAMQSAEGKVQNFKYQATFPILINISGLPTYFITLKDDAGLVKMYSMVSVRDYSIVGVGETVKSAKDNYLLAISSAGVETIPSASTEKKSLISTIARIGSDVRNGRSYYYINLTDLPTKIFVANSDLSSQLPVSKVGDQVEVVFIEAPDKEISLSNFRNLSIK